jgi:short-subunit dehydrogenase
MAYWQNKVCLVTGGSAGLGLAIGRALAARGAKLILTARRVEPLEAAAAELRRAGGDVHVLAGDVAWQEDVDRIAAAVNERFGQLDLLCNCAGRSTRGAVLDVSPEDFQQLLEVNFFATVRMTRALASPLLASRGHLVNVGSLASKTAARFLGAYPVSKFAVAAYTQQLRLELSERGVHVMLVCPGPIARDEASLRYLAEAPAVPPGAHGPGGGTRLKAIDPNQLAIAILNGAEQRRPELVVPGKARLLFALSQLSASWGDRLLRRFIKA